MSAGRSACIAAAFSLLVLAPSLTAAAERAKRACQLLEPEEIMASFPADHLSDSEKGDIPGTCLWLVDGGPEAGGGVIATFLERGSTARDSFRLTRAVSAADLVEIDGIGRNAFFAIDTVYVLQTKRTFFYVQGLFPATTGMATADLQASLEALAEIAADRA